MSSAYGEKNSLLTPTTQMHLENQRTKERRTCNPRTDQEFLGNPISVYTPKAICVPCYFIGWACRKQHEIIIETIACLRQRCIELDLDKPRWNDAWTSWNGNNF